MRTIGSTWLIVLRCSECQSCFSVRGIQAADIAHTPHAAACPDCGHNPGVTSTFFLSARQHLIMGLEKERRNS